MAKIFVANLSKQHQVMMYRIPEAQAPRSQHIAIGEQVQLAGDLTEAQIQGIIDQHRAYGLKSATEARRIKGFTGLVYSINEPVPLNDQGFVADVFEANDALLDERTAGLRERATAAMSDRLSTIASEARAPLQRVEVEQVEETDGTPKVAVGVEAVTENVTPRNRGAQRPSR